MPVVVIGNSKMEYTLLRRAKKYIYIMIGNEGNVIVSAPKRVPLYEIESVIKEKYNWIKNQLSKVQYKKSEFENGKMIWYRGLEHEASILPFYKNQVEIFDHKIIIYGKEISSEAAENVFNQWLHREADKVFYQEMKKWVAVMDEYQLSMPTMQVRKMKSRWGSCIPSKNKICLNVALMRVPPACMEYVVLHELTHLIEANHSKAFYSIVEKYMPDWKTRKELLNREYGNIL